MDQGRKLTYIRIYSGSVKAGDTVFNPGERSRKSWPAFSGCTPTRGSASKKPQPEISSAVMGLKITTTGDTLCTEDHPILLEPIHFNTPVISMAVEPKGVQDQERLLDALAKLSDEDPTFKFRIDDETGQTVISGMGELHLEIIVKRLRREFLVETNQGKPQVVYRETISKRIEHEEIFQRELAGQQHFAGVKIELIPLPRGTGNRFVDRCENPNLTEEFLTAIKEGIEEAPQAGCSWDIR